MCLFLERANAEGDWFFFRGRLLTGFAVVVRLVTSLLLSLALLGGSFGAKFAADGHASQGGVET